MRSGVVALLLVLIPTAAHASFSAAPCGTFECHFENIGILLGFLGGLPPHSRGGSPVEAFLVVYALLAILSVLYVRSAPRSAREAH